MIVEWKKPNLKVIPIRAIQNSVVDGKTVGRIITKSTVILTPGGNDIPDEQWEELKANVQDNIDLGDLIVHQKEDLIGNSKGGKGKEVTKKSNPVPFKDLSTGKKKALIKDTENIKSLDKWLSAEPDETLKVDIKKRIEEIKVYLKTGKKPEDQEEDLVFG